MTRRFPSGDQLARAGVLLDNLLRRPAIHADHIYFIARSGEGNLRSVRGNERERPLPLEGRSTAYVRFHRCGYATECGPGRKCRRPTFHPWKRLDLSPRSRRGMARIHATSCHSGPVRHAAWYQWQRSAFRHGSDVHLSRTAGPFVSGIGFLRRWKSPVCIGSAQRSDLPPCEVSYTRYFPSELHLPQHGCAAWLAFRIVERPVPSAAISTNELSPGDEIENIVKTIRFPSGEILRQQTLSAAETACAGLSRLCQQRTSLFPWRGGCDHQERNQHLLPRSCRGGAALPPGAESTIKGTRDGGRTFPRDQNSRRPKRVTRNPRVPGRRSGDQQVW